MMKRIDKQYVSEIDKKMAQFNATHPLSAEQKAENEKYKSIHHRRDVPTDPHHTENDLWK